MYIGIDVGKTGGLCAMNEIGEIIEMIQTPVISKEYDVREIVNFIKKHNPKHIGIEDVHAIFGSSAKTTFQFGFGKGLLIGIVESIGIPYTLVTPKDWQKIAWQGISPVKNSKGKNDTKKISLIAAKRLFPGEKFLATQRCSTPHDGMIDATLISYYLKVIGR